jgi:hypothetical protein
MGITVPIFVTLCAAVKMAVFDRRPLDRFNVDAVKDRVLNQCQSDLVLIRVHLYLSVDKIPVW